MTAVLQASDLTKHFRARRGLFGADRGTVRAVDGISFAVETGQTLGVVGESGCGKTTTAKLVLGLEEPSGGAILFDGHDLAKLDASGRRTYRRSVQLVSGKFAVLDDAVGFSLVPWRPVIEQRLGMSMTALVRGDFVSYEFGRTRGLGL